MQNRHNSNLCLAIFILQTAYGIFQTVTRTVSEYKFRFVVWQYEKIVI